MLDILDEIAKYEAERGAHAKGTLSAAVMEQFTALAGAAPVRRSIETGCGKSTILLSRIMGEHWCYTIDDSAYPNGSLSFVRGCPTFCLERVHFVIGPSQITLAQNP